MSASAPTVVSTRVFAEKLAAYLEALQPSNVVERDLVENMAAAQTKIWHLDQVEETTELARRRKEAEQSYHRALKALMNIRRFERIEHQSAERDAIRRENRQETVRAQIEEIRKSSPTQKPPQFWKDLAQTVLSSFPKPAHLLRYESKIANTAPIPQSACEFTHAT